MKFKCKMLKPPFIPEDGALAGLLGFMNELVKRSLIAKEPVEEMKRAWQGQAWESGRKMERRRASLLDIIVGDMVAGMGGVVDTMLDRMGSLIEKGNGCRPFVENQFAQISSHSTVISFQETFSQKCTFNSAELLPSAVCLCPNDGNIVSVLYP